MPMNIPPRSIGVGQTWQSVTRGAGVTYTNTTGKPIVMNVAISGSGTASCSTNISINGGAAFTFASVASGTGPSAAAGSVVIPVGATYVLGDVNVTGRTTFELR